MEDGTGESSNVPQTPWGDEGPVAFTVCWDGQLPVESAGILADAEASLGERRRGVDLVGKLFGDGSCEIPEKLEAISCPWVQLGLTPCSEPLLDAMEAEASLGERRQEEEPSINGEEVRRSGLG